MSIRKPINISYPYISTLSSIEPFSKKYHLLAMTSCFLILFAELFTSLARHVVCADLMQLNTYVLKG